VTTPLLEVSGLRTEIDTDRGAIRPVHDVSFTLSQGETVCLVGESGSGKSLLARSLMGVLPERASVVAGTIHLGGEEITRLRGSTARKLRGGRLAFVPQEPMTAFDPLYRVGDQTIEALLAHEGISWDDAANRMLAALGDVGLPDPMRAARSLPGQLSGGMNQRALIAMALVTGPMVLIADEPTTALDSTVQAQVLELLKRLQVERGLGVLLVTHDMGVAATMADRILVMYGGRIVEDGATAAVFAEPRHPYTHGLIESSRASLAADRSYHWIAGAPPDLHAMPPGCAFAPRCPHARDACTEAVPVMRSIGRTAYACVLSDEERPWLNEKETV
jgi:oligopeptide/dipeptide ABC transporter ATP-binding protein